MRIYYSKELWKFEENQLKYNHEKFHQLMQKDIKYAAPPPNESRIEKWHAKWETCNILLAYYPRLVQIKDNQNMKTHNRYLKGDISKILPDKKFLQSFHKIELFLEKQKLYYEQMNVLNACERFHYFCLSMEHLLLDEDLLKCDINLKIVKSFINGFLEQLCGKSVYLDKADNRWKELTSKVPIRWRKFETVLTFLNVQYKNFDIGIVRSEWQKLASTDGFFKLSLQLIESELAKMRNEAEKILVTLGEKWEIELNDKNTGKYDARSRPIKIDGLRSQIIKYKNANYEEDFDNFCNEKIELLLNGAKSDCQYKSKLTKKNQVSFIPNGHANLLYWRSKLNTTFPLLSMIFEQLTFMKQSNSANERLFRIFDKVKINLNNTRSN